MANEIGAALRRIRKNRGESIVEVAKATHTSPASFTKWENEQTTPSERSVRKLAEYYSIEPVELLALAYPDKYAPKEEAAPEEDLSNSIRIEDVISPDTDLSFNGKLVSDQDKHLIGAFVSGLLLSKKEYKQD
ncbi:helix-turn-helix domain-containing protein [Lacticaseibacillus zhaodongensis]|uniref:helix-turn-helix domain-containing protein n=1 Tax=Lacticaseibacillus zhaodongensis TaxID=2668065 RepID=UPI0012D334CB|nr:helix-turn-helix transcriptional regulator [Lacticaseibacillus zhaodongensis]